MKAKIMIVGEGGREDALRWKLKQSPHVGEIFSSREGNLLLKPYDIEGLALFAEENNIDLTVVGPELPLAIGIVDTFHRLGLKIFGPTRSAAKIESSKGFAKNLMMEARIPTAEYKVFKNFKEACKYCEKNLPAVIKADGLAGGKGVYICRTYSRCVDVLTKIMKEHIHGDAGKEVIIEDFLAGEEASLHLLCDGKTSIAFPVSKDYKRFFDGDKEINTGGMGAISPVPWISTGFLKESLKRIAWPILGALARNNSLFKGLLYPGVMLTKSGPYVLEYNARFGDPETQVYMRNLKSDLYELMIAAVDQKLSEYKIEWHPGYAVCVSITGKNYPERPKEEIKGIEAAQKIPGVEIFKYLSGGRVLSVTARGETLDKAIELAYQGVKKIKFEGMHYRADIGKRKI